MIECHIQSNNLIALKDNARMRPIDIQPTQGFFNPKFPPTRSAYEKLRIRLREMTQRLRSQFP
jgi:hypothetical protein